MNLIPAAFIPAVEFLEYGSDMLSDRFSRENQCTVMYFTVIVVSPPESDILLDCAGHPLLRNHTISCQSIEAITAVCPEKLPEVGERMVILRFGISIAVLKRPEKPMLTSLLGPG